MKTFVFILLLSSICNEVLSFFHGVPVRDGTVLMGGGRSPAEKGKTTGTMFRELRKKFNEAAEVPGFFEVGAGAAEIDLMVKSNRDGSQIGACPKSQFVQMVLLKKGISYKIFPTPSTEGNKNEVPALSHKGGEKITDALDIAEYIEKAFPHSSLTRQGTFSYQEVLERTSGFFPALSAYLTNKDTDSDPSLLDAVNKQLDVIDEVIRSTPGKFSCGLDLTLADLYLLPQLFHAVVGMSHFKQEEILNVGADPKRPALENYLVRLMDMEEFNDKRAYCNADTVIYDWKIARGEA